ncbi:MAG: hypothetical protein ACI9Y1_001884 [Lentisphaeria bacterium]|jgi:hypothetical protein
MNRFRMKQTKPLLYWSVYTRIGLALALSLAMWVLVIGVTHSS